MSVKRTTYGTISILFRALVKEPWQEGPTQSEAIDYTKDWFYNTFGYDVGAEEGLPRLHGEPIVPEPRRRHRKTRKYT